MLTYFARVLNNSYIESFSLGYLLNFLRLTYEHFKILRVEILRIEKVKFNFKMLRNIVR